MALDPRAPALQAFDVCKRYPGGVRALSDVAVTVPLGSITALVGPNAAGKSTLIKTWMSFERPTSGSVRVCGIDPWRDRAAALARLGYVPQQASLYRALTVGDHLDWVSHVRPGFDQAEAKNHLRSLDVPLDARPTRLSGGQQAQVMLAVALGTRADVLLLDEPLASLDPLARSEFLTLLRSEVRGRGGTALLSSHIVTDIEQSCDRLVVLGVGRVLLHDSLKGALAGHGVAKGTSGTSDGLREIGRIPSETGEENVVVRLPRGSGVDGIRATGLRSATLDEIVKGYLVASRRTHRDGQPS